MAEQIIEISDDGTNDTYVVRDEKGNALEERVNHDHIQRSRLRVDARKWLLSKMRPEKYGDRTILAGDKDQPLLVHTRSVLDNPPEK